MRTEMRDNAFEGAWLDYEILTLNADEAAALLQPSEWDDGFLAFSNTEMRLKDLPRGLSSFDLCCKSIDGLDGVEGYLMEADLWRRRGEVFEEISLEREHRCFFFQKWKVRLVTGKEKSNCYWQLAKTFARTPIGSGKDLFGKGNLLPSIEVIQPETRLHFFITTGGE